MILFEIKIVHLHIIQFIANKDNHIVLMLTLCVFASVIRGL